MSTQIRRRRNTTANLATFAGAGAEIVVDTDKNVVVVCDGLTNGGFPQAREDMVNVPASAVTGKIDLMLLDEVS
ncbi:MAG: hypothetical protein K5872_08820 [Rhizobiaceae bacterium]|nr:hypothetical protein [Rhizobiaceae bacterium]MCV0406317.1 hypothetical protein [Rhizobiaceae bacterium]